MVCKNQSDNQIDPNTLIFQILIYQNEVEQHSVYHLSNTNLVVVLMPLWMVLFAVLHGDFDMPNHNLPHLYGNLDRNSAMIDDDPNDVNDVVVVVVSW